MIDDVSLQRIVGIKAFCWCDTWTHHRPNLVVAIHRECSLSLGDIPTLLTEFTVANEG